MQANIINFPVATVTRAAKARPARAAGNTIVSFQGWQARTRLHRTAHGVFFKTRVLTTPGDVA